MAVLKKNGQIRICGDFKVTLNPQLNVAKYPIPKIDELFARLGSCSVFSQIDLSQAYAQFELEDNSKEYVTINTHKGLFRYNRLPYRLASSPAIFQRIIESILANIKEVAVFLDDILVASSSMQDHLKTLNEVFSILQKYGLKVQITKCEFIKHEVEYLGYKWK